MMSLAQINQTGQTSHWVHDLDPVAIQLWGDFGIRYYGLAYGLGVVIGFFVLLWLNKTGRSPLKREQIVDVLLIIFVGVIVGGRIGFILLYALDSFMADPLVLFRIWEGGMASHGGFLGVAVAAWFVSKKFPVGFLQLGDMLALAAAPGLMLGRIANFINSELVGKVSDAPWAIIFKRAQPLDGVPMNDMPRHPAQLYEAAAEGLIPFVYMMIRVTTSNVLLRPGRLLGEFFVIYSVGRAIAEYFKVPDQATILGINPGAFYSFFILAVGVFMIWRDIKLQKNSVAR